MIKASLADKYRQEVAPALMKEFGLGNPMKVPVVRKVVVNMGAGLIDKNLFESHLKNLATVTGQRPVVTRAKRSISNFKVREGMNLGAKVTLRRQVMYEFLDRLINFALPRIRDFRGISPNCFDGRGNCTIGLTDLDIFPEIDPNQIGGSQGMDIAIVVSADSDDMSRALLKGLGMPFAKKK